MTNFRKQFLQLFGALTLSAFFSESVVAQATQTTSHRVHFGECAEMMESINQNLVSRSFSPISGDASQTAAEKMWKHCLKHGVASINDPEKYHARARRNALIDELNGGSRFAAFDEDEQGLDAVLLFHQERHGDDETFLPSHEHQVKGQILAVLSARERLAIALLGQGWTVDQVAHHLNTSTEAVYKLKQRGTSKLKSLADDEGWTYRQLIALFGLGALVWLIGNGFREARNNPTEYERKNGASTERGSLPQKEKIKLKVKYR